MELLITLHSVNLPVALSQTCMCTQQENQPSNLILPEEERTQVDEQLICDYDLPALGIQAMPWTTLFLSSQFHARIPCSLVSV